MRTDCAGGAHHRHGCLLSLLVWRVFRRSRPCHCVSRSGGGRARLWVHRASGTRLCQNQARFALVYLGETGRCECQISPARFKGTLLSSSLLILSGPTVGSDSLLFRSISHFSSTVTGHFQCLSRGPEWRRATTATGQKISLLSPAVEDSKARDSQGVIGVRT